MCQLKPEFLMNYTLCPCWSCNGSYEFINKEIQLESQLECTPWLVILSYLSLRMCTMIGQFIISLSWKVHYDWLIYYISRLECALWLVDYFISQLEYALLLVNLFYFSVRMCTMIGQFIISQLECALLLINLLYFSVRMFTVIGQFIISLS